MIINILCIPFSGTISQEGKKFTGWESATIAANAEDRPVCYPRDAFHDAEPCVSRYSGPIIP